MPERRRSLRRPQREEEEDSLGGLRSRPVPEEAVEQRGSGGLRPQPLPEERVAHMERTEGGLRNHVPETDIRTAVQRGDRSVFRRGLAQGGAQIRASGPAIGSIARGLVGDEEGAQASAERAMEEMDRGQARGPQTSFQGVLDGEHGAVEYLAGLAGSQTPILATIFGTGGAAGLVGRAAAHGAQRQAVRTAGEAARRRAADTAARRKVIDRAHGEGRKATRSEAGRLGQATSQQNLARKKLDEVLLRRKFAGQKGAKHGAAGGSFAAITGTIAGEGAPIILDEDSGSSIQARAGAALGGSVVGGAINTLPAMQVFRNLGLGGTANHLTTQALRNQTRTGTVARGVAKTGSFEASAEAATQATMRTAHKLINENIEVFSDEGLMEMLEGAIAGSLIGGAMGGASSFRLNMPGPTETETARRSGERQLQGRENRLQFLSEDEQANRSQHPNVRMDRAKSAVVGDVIHESLAMDDGQPSSHTYEDALETGQLLRVLIDPEAESGEVVTLKDGTEATLAEVAQKFLEQRYGIDLSQVIDLAREIFAEAENFDIQRIEMALESLAEIDRLEGVVPEADETGSRVQSRQELEQQLERERARLRSLLEPTETAAETADPSRVFDQAEDGTTGETAQTAPADPNAGIDPRSGDALQNVEAPFRPALSQREGQQPIISLKQNEGLDTPRLGKMFVSPRTRGNKEHTKTNKAEEVVDRLNNETGSSGDFTIAKAGEALIRTLRSEFGLEPTEPATNRADFQQRVIEEAQRVQEAQSNKNQVRGERALQAQEDGTVTYEQAIEFLNQFDTVVEERLPTALSGRDEQNLSAEQLRRDNIVYQVPDRPLEGHEVQLTDAEGNPQVVDLIALTQAMVKPVDKAGRGGSQEARQQAGRKFEQGTAPRSISDENIGRAVAAGLAELITRNGYRLGDQSEAADTVQRLTQARRELEALGPEGDAQAEFDRASLQDEVVRLEQELANQFGPEIQAALQDDAVAFRTRQGTETTVGGAGLRGAAATRAEIQNLTNLRELRQRKAKLQEDLKDSRAKNLRELADEQQRLLRAVNRRIRTVERARQATQRAREEDINTKAQARRHQKLVDRLKESFRAAGATDLSKAILAAFRRPDLRLRKIKAEREAILQNKQAEPQQETDLQSVNEPFHAEGELADRALKDYGLTEARLSRERLVALKKKRDAAIAAREGESRLMRMSGLINALVNNDSRFDLDTANEAVSRVYEIVDQFSEAFNMPEPRIVFAIGKGSAQGKYDPETHTVSIHADLLSPSGKIARFATPLLHEMSHGLEFEAMFNMTPREMAAVARDYSAWREQAARRLHGKTGLERGEILHELLHEKRGPLALSKAVKSETNFQRALDKESYIISAREWFADNAARMILEDSFVPSENSLALEAFKKLADVLKQVYERVVLKRDFTPQDAPGLRKFLQGLRGVTEPQPVKIAEPQPLSKADQARLDQLAAEERLAQRDMAEVEQLQNDLAELGPSDTLKMLQTEVRLYTLLNELRTRTRREENASNRTAEERYAALLREFLAGEVSRPEVETQGESIDNRDGFLEEQQAKKNREREEGHAPPWADTRDGDVPSFEQRNNEAARAEQDLQDAGISDLPVKVVGWAEAEVVFDDRLNKGESLETVEVISDVVNGELLIYVNENLTNESARRAAINNELGRLAVNRWAESLTDAEARAVLKEAGFKGDKAQLMKLLRQRTGAFGALRTSANASQVRAFYEGLVGQLGVGGKYKKLRQVLTQMEQAVDGPIDVANLSTVRGFSSQTDRYSSRWSEVKRKWTKSERFERTLTAVLEGRGKPAKKASKKKASKKKAAKKKAVRKTSQPAQKAQFFLNTKISTRQGDFKLAELINNEGVSVSDLVFLFIANDEHGSTRGFIESTESLPDEISGLSNNQVTKLKREIAQARKEGYAVYAARKSRESLPKESRSTFDTVSGFMADVRNVLGVEQAALVVGKIPGADGAVNMDGTMFLPPSFFAKQPTADEVFTLLHETGHLLEAQVMASATERQRKAIRAEHEKWRAPHDKRLAAAKTKAQKQKVLQEAIAHKRQHFSPRQRSLIKKAFTFDTPVTPEYALGFTEWFADIAGQQMLQTETLGQAVTSTAARSLIAEAAKSFRTMFLKANKWFKQALKLDASQAPVLQQLLEGYMADRTPAPTAQAQDAPTARQQDGPTPSEDGQGGPPQTPPRSSGGGRGGPPQGPPASPPGGDAPTPGDAFNAKFMLDAPFSVEGFYAVRDMMINRLTAEERRTLAQAFNAVPVRAKMIKFLKKQGIEHEGFLDDQFNLIALGHNMHKAGLLELNASASGVMNGLHSFAHKIMGLIRSSEAAVEIMEALNDGRIASRQSVVMETAKQGSNLQQGLYSLSSSDFSVLYDMLDMRKLFDAVKRKKVSTEQLLDMLNADRDFQKLPGKVQRQIAADVKNGVFTKKFMKSVKDESDFTLHPDKQFVLERAVGNNVLQRGARAIAAGIQFFGPMARILQGEAMRARATGNPAIIDLLNSVYTDITSQGRAEAMFSRKQRRRAAFDAEYTQATERLNDAQLKELRDVMLDPNKKAHDPEVIQARRRISRLTAKMRNYAIEAGLDIGYRGNDYVPWVFNPEKMARHSEDLIDDWMRPEYKAEWAKLARKRGELKLGEEMSDTRRREMIRRIVNGIAVENNGFAEDAGTMNDPLQANVPPKVGAMNTRELAFLSKDKTSSDLLSKVFADDVHHTMGVYIDQMVKRVEYARTFGPKGEKFTRLVNRAKEFGASQRDLELMHNMADSALGRIGLPVAPFWKAVMTPIEAAFMKPVDNNGKPFTSAEQAAKVRRQRNIKGRVTKNPDGQGYIIDRAITNDPARFRQAMAWMVIYQNFRVLAFAALTNVADLAGIFVRTGLATEALRAYAAGIKEVGNSIKSRKLPPKERQAQMTELRKLAQELGIVEFSVISDIMGQLYATNMMDGKAKRWNDKLFKWNGMEYLTRSTRMMALAAGRNYLVSKARQAAQGDQASIRELAELDLDFHDISVANGELSLLTTPEIDAMLEPYRMTSSGAVDQAVSQQAFDAMPEGKAKDRQRVLRQVARDDRLKRGLYRMVDESVLRPSASQRPTWMNNPNWMIFSHLKGFLFTYHERVLRRGYTQAAQGNFGPMMRMSSYVGMIMAMDLLREMVQHSFDGDDRKEDWTFRDRLQDGTRRSGVGGVGTFFMDMQASRQFGSNLFFEAGGPTTSQVNHLWRAFGRGHANMGTAMKRSLPANQVLDVGVNWTDYFMESTIGLGLDDVRALQVIHESPMMNRDIQQEARKLLLRE